MKLPFCYECGAEINTESKFCPECGTRIIRNPEQVAISANVPSFQANHRTKKKTNKSQKFGALMAIVLVLGIVAVILLTDGSLGNLLSNTASPGTPSPTPPLVTHETVYPSWIKINNWYKDQIVRYVAVNLATGQSYEANYGVAPWPGTSQNPVTGTVALPLPENGLYKVTVYTAGGDSVWWNSVFLNVENQQNPANINLAALQNGFANSSGNLNTSTLDNIQCSGSS